MERELAAYIIDGWRLRLPKEWDCTLDRDPRLPQAVFDTTQEDIMVYVTTWDFQEAAAERIGEVYRRAFAEAEGLAALPEALAFFPEGLGGLAGKSVTEDDRTMITCALWDKGYGLMLFFVCEHYVDWREYVRYVGLVERI